ncbi:hypothetical protein [uncultured Algibacter sp.]|uniref:hypothetical protein n=1 Tax=uncultured Algibacter sp. TaxID=298659 RepID=UPI003217218A
MSVQWWYLLASPGLLYLILLSSAYVLISSIFSLENCHSLGVLYTTLKHPQYTSFNSPVLQVSSSLSLA